MSSALVRAAVLAVSAMVFSPYVSSSMAQEGIAAQPADTAALAALCSSEDLDFCYGYLTASAQFYGTLVTDPDVDVEPFVCPGRPVSQAEARSVFLDWYAGHEAAGAEPPLDGLFRAWAAQFPCS